MCLKIQRMSRPYFLFERERILTITRSATYVSVGTWNHHLMSCLLTPVRPRIFLANPCIDHCNEEKNGFADAPEMSLTKQCKAVKVWNGQVTRLSCADSAVCLTVNLAVFWSFQRRPKCLRCWPSANSFARLVKITLRRPLPRSSTVCRNVAIQSRR
jgi:hypothetical protein